MAFEFITNPKNTFYKIRDEFNLKYTLYRSNVRSELRISNPNMAKSIDSLAAHVDGIIRTIEGWLGDEGLGAIPLVFAGIVFGTLAAIVGYLALRWKELNTQFDLATSQVLTVEQRDRAIERILTPQQGGFLGGLGLQQPITLIVLLGFAFMFIGRRA